MVAVALVVPGSTAASANALSVVGGIMFKCFVYISEINRGAAKWHVYRVGGVTKSASIPSRRLRCRRV